MDTDQKNKLFEFFAAKNRNLRRYVAGKLHNFSEADAEDIIGDVMLKLFTRSQPSGPLHNPAGYVYRALNNKIIDFRRTQSRTVPLESCLNGDGELSLMALLSDSAPGPEKEAERRDFMRRFGKAVGLMPSIFGLGEITYWQAIGIFVLAKLIFGFGSGDHSESKSKKDKAPQCDERSAHWTEYESWWETEGKKSFEQYKEQKAETSDQ